MSETIEEEEEVAEKKIKSLLKKTKQDFPGGTKDLTRDLSGILADDKSDDSDHELEKETASLKQSNRPSGRMTRNVEAKLQNEERMRVVRAKLAEVQCLSDDIDIEQERPTVIRFAETVEEKVIESRNFVAPKGTPKPARISKTK